MDQIYSINEILLAVEEIQNKEKVKKVKRIKKEVKKDYSVIPKNTLKLIEEAENKQ